MDYLGIAGDPESSSGRNDRWIQKKKFIPLHIHSVMEINYILNQLIPIAGGDSRNNQRLL